jgi:hypothetical protein
MAAPGSAILERARSLAIRSEIRLKARRDVKRDRPKELAHALRIAATDCYLVQRLVESLQPDGLVLTRSAKHSHRDVLLMHFSFERSFFKVISD